MSSIGSELALFIQPLKNLLANLQGKADLGHVELIYSDQGVVVLLRHMKNLSDADVAAIKAFATDHQINFFSQGSTRQVVCLVGQEKLTYQLDEGQLSLSFAVTDFLQVNAKINQKMVTQALQWLQLEAQDVVLDLFCGLGNFTLPMAQKVARVVGVEGVQKMVDRARFNAQLNDIDNSEFYQADLSADNLKKQPWSPLDFNKILLDPARAGAQDCMAFIAAKKPTHIVYVSCDPLTLARDSQILLEKGYKLAKLGLIDMFPQTKHVESMALFLK
ncbi:23S rRNA (uracil(1939)-C(5))-methyltransferase RlmD [Psychromonas sp. MME2]|uniref:23S rRNA (uracil(1939)-C(5))-methyltransferase RlmD n=1 Tax=Psychromonas sp. MME2 TaxID=3231033 RepID=UPI00339C448F